MSHRKEQIEAMLQKAVSQLLATKLADPRLEGLVSITRVDLTPDFSDATVYVSVLPQRNESRALYGLSHAAGHIQSLLRKATALRSVPRLNFKIDGSLKKQDDVLDAIERARRRDQSLAIPGAGDGGSAHESGPASLSDDSTATDPPPAPEIRP
ncbi:MAG: 30S ribosome-binding factor RbfA [Phycisphaeraceae bacterium]|nr:30S ribosome-binding factor RbfA [Phycisphaeraceae bacterium]